MSVKSFFVSGIIPKGVARSNIVLVPKVQDASHVTDFRPISICNIVYKVISKVLARRIKPYMNQIISKAQSAFIARREISESVVLLREVLHSFRQKSYRNQQFCLKVDLSKAFDRMNWSYLESILPMYGFPPEICKWIMLCVTSAEYTVILNGRGDGFFRPTCGLRQGCVLSPYLFIIGMDILSRQLQFQVESGVIRGLRITRSAKALTNCLYADDLLLFGEATHMAKTVKSFSEISGQRVRPSKSSIWFNNQTNQQTREEVEALFDNPPNNASTIYLGAPIQTNAASYDFLIEKVTGKLQAWKSRLLSQAGRVVLLKSVLQSLPIC